MVGAIAGCSPRWTVPTVDPVTTTLSPTDKASAPRPTTTLSPMDKASAPRPSAESGYPPVLWVLLGGNFLVRALGFAYPFMAYFVAQRGHGPGAVGAVLAAYGGGWVAGQLVSGWLVDRVGGRRTLVAAMLLAAVVLTLLAGAHSMAALLVGAGLVGLANNATRPVVSAAIAELIPDPTKRAKVDALRYGFVMNAGSAIAGGLGGLLAVRIGIPALDVIEAAACAVFALLALVFMAPDTHRPMSVDKTGYRQAFSDKRLVLLLVLSVMTLTAMMGIFAAMPMLMSAAGLSVGAYGIAQLANALAVVAVTPFITPWLSRRVELRPRLDIMAVAAMSVTVCMAAAAFAHTTAGFAVAAAGVRPVRSRGSSSLPASCTASPRRRTVGATTESGGWRWPSPRSPPRSWPPTASDMAGRCSSLSPP